jgi:hypothetical protein
MMAIRVLRMLEPESSNGFFVITLFLFVVLGSGGDFTGIAPTHTRVARRSDKGSTLTGFIVTVTAQLARWPRRRSMQARRSLLAAYLFLDGS